MWRRRQNSWHLSQKKKGSYGKEHPFCQFLANGRKGSHCYLFIGSSRQQINMPSAVHSNSCLLFRAVNPVGKEETRFPRLKDVTPSNQRLNVRPFILKCRLDCCPNWDCASSGGGAGILSLISLLMRDLISSLTRCSGSNARSLQNVRVGCWERDE